MSSYSELIKNFEKIRAYMREFYVYGFKSRDDYQKKSARSYDDERRRLETLVIGGEKDLSLGGDASKEIAEKIPSAELRMYEQWGHGLYEEAKDFNQAVLCFLRK